MRLSNCKCSSVAWSSSSWSQKNHDHKTDQRITYTRTRTRCSLWRGANDQVRVPRGPASQGHESATSQRFAGRSSLQLKRTKGSCRRRRAGSYHRPSDKLMKNSSPEHGSKAKESRKSPPLPARRKIDRDSGPNSCGRHCPWDRNDPFEKDGKDHRTSKLLGHVLPE